MNLLKMAKAFDKLSQVDVPSKSRSLKDRLMDKLSITAQSIGGYPSIDTFTQSALKSLVNPNLKVDGLMGPETVAALNAYKQQRNIPQATPLAQVKQYLSEEAYTGKVSVPAAPGAREMVARPDALNQGINDINTVNKTLSPVDHNLLEPGSRVFPGTT